MPIQVEPAHNGLLARLPASERKRIAALMQHVTLDFKLVLYEYQAPIDFVYFPTSGTASALTIMEDGDAIEVATIGNEGVVGLSVLLAGETSANKVIVQVAGDALRMNADVLRQEAGV